MITVHFDPHRCNESPQSRYFVDLHVGIFLTWCVGVQSLSYLLILLLISEIVRPQQNCSTNWQPCENHVNVLKLRKTRSCLEKKLSNLIILRYIFLAVVLATLTATSHAQSGQCGFIKDADRQAYCRATSGGGSGQCGFIRDGDLQAMCRAQTGGGSGQCGFIRNNDMQAECRAKTK